LNGFQERGEEFRIRIGRGLVCYRFKHTVQASSSEPSLSPSCFSFHRIEGFGGHSQPLSSLRARFRCSSL
jgi:hypothetical protein